MKNLQYHQPAIELLRSVAGTEADSIQGVSDAELTSVEAGLPGEFSLPASLREWYETAGFSAGKLFRTRDLSFRHLELLVRTRFKDCRDPLLLEDDEEFSDNLLIFHENQAMFITFCYLDQGDNPPVYIWDESMDALEDAPQKYDSFSEYIYATVQVHKDTVEFRP